MGKQLNIYNHYKTSDPNKYYLFKGGVFYYFIAEDAEYFSLKYNFILTSFGSTVKCGFPVKSLEKYLYLFNKENIMLIEEDVTPEKIVINVLKKLNIDKLEPKDALNVLINLRDTLDGK